MFDAKFKLLFFDRVKVTDPAEKAALKAQSKFGAFVMRRARSSIKVKEGRSRPGTPPHAHLSYESTKKVNKKTGKRQVRYLFRDSILFGRDPSGSTIVGPVLKSGGVTRPTVPQLHEFGGTGTVTRGRRRGKSARFVKRPTMAPAMEKELPKFAGLFRGSIGG